MSTAVLLSSWESSFFPSLQKIVYHKLMFKFVKYFSVVINIIMIFFLGLLMWFFSNIKAAFHTWNKFPFSSVQFSSLMSNCLQPHESQHARSPCPSTTPGVHSDSRLSSRWCHPAISSSVVPFSSCPDLSQHQSLSNESTLRMRWPKYRSFSFSISPSNEHPGLISFRIDWLDLLAVQGTLKSLP